MAIRKLKNVIQHYQWGSFDAIPRLLGMKNERKLPYAELWMGTHPQGHSLIDPGEELLKVVMNDTNASLPFLFKIISARLPLSIQVHPNKYMAEMGYKNEEEKAVPYNAPERIYKDMNHKPELFVALERSFALSSFRPSDIIQSDIACLSLPDISGHTDEEMLAGCFNNLLFSRHEVKQEYISAACNWAATQTQTEFDHYWWVLYLAENFPDDIGCVAPFFLNLIELNKNEAIYIPSSETHSYLRVNGIEIMATSDNVLRAGCTSKHIAAAEFMQTASFAPYTPITMKPSVVSFCESYYHTPAKEFELSCINLPANRQITAVRKKKPEIMLCMSGSPTIQGNTQKITLKAGESVYISPDEWYITINGEALLYRASTPGAVGMLQDFE